MPNGKALRTILKSQNWFNHIRLSSKTVPFVHLQFSVLVFLQSNAPTEFKEFKAICTHRYLLIIDPHCHQNRHGL